MKDALFQTIESHLELDRNREYKILDIGCGSGRLLGLLSGSISPDSVLVGVDAAENSIASARENFPQMQFLHQRFSHSLDFEDQSFDRVVSVDLLECIPDKQALIDEVRRVLKPGGKMIFAHWDWDTQVYNSVHKTIVRKLVAAFSDWQQDWMETSDGRMGRRLWELFEGSGKFRGKIASFTLLETEYRAGNYGFDRLHDLSVLVEAGSIEPAEYRLICDEMQALSAKKGYFYSVNSYIYVGEPV